MLPWKHKNSVTNNMATTMQDSNDIKLTSEEVQRLHEAFQDKNFLKLFQDYVEDINSEESQQKYEEEIIQLEKDRGYDVKFVHPTPVYVIKFVSNGKKTFINICENKYVREAIGKKKDSGIEWQIPVILSKPRDDTDKKGTGCRVCDVMYHPQTIELALKDRRFKQLVEDTALSMMVENFGISLDGKTAIYPKMKYKGKSPRVVLRKKLGSEESSVSCEPFEDYWKKRVESELKVQKQKQVTPLSNKTPKYKVKYRDIIDMKDYSLMGYTDKCAPKEIIIEIMLPNVEKASDVELDIFERKLSLKSCENANHRYQLDLNLSYAVKTEDGTAKFDKSNSKLIVELPVKDRKIPEILERNIEPEK